MSLDPHPRRLARTSDPSTSHAAAVDGAGQPRVTHRAKILDAIRGAGPTGMTYEEAGLATDVENAWRRCSDLLNAGLITPLTVAGVEQVRLMSSGRYGRIYVVDHTYQGRLFSDDS